MSEITKETLAEEFARLVREEATGSGSEKEEAWNLIADFAIDNADALTAALAVSRPHVEITEKMVEAAFAKLRSYGYGTNSQHCRSALKDALTTALAVFQKDGADIEAFPVRRTVAVSRPQEMTEQEANRRSGSQIDVSAPENNSLRATSQESGAVLALAKAVLSRDAEWAPSGSANDCNCINLNRAAEQEYETGTCPHQRLRAAIRALPAHSTGGRAGGWGDIETAPKDGTDLLVFSGEADTPVMIGHWSEAEDRKFAADDGWYERETGYYFDVAITHWQPLPAPPLPTAEQGGGT